MAQKHNIPELFNFNEGIKFLNAIFIILEEIGVDSRIISKLTPEWYNSSNIV